MRSCGKGVRATSSAGRLGFETQAHVAVGQLGGTDGVGASGPWQDEAHRSAVLVGSTCAEGGLRPRRCPQRPADILTKPKNLHDIKMLQPVDVLGGGVTASAGTASGGGGIAHTVCYTHAPHTHMEHVCLP